MRLCRIGRKCREETLGQAHRKLVLYAGLVRLPGEAVRVAVLRLEHVHPDCRLGLPLKAEQRHQLLSSSVWISKSKAPPAGTAPPLKLMARYSLVPRRTGA